jgi:hypothetical protein
LPKFFSDLIRDLRDEVWRLHGEGNAAQTKDQIGGEAVVLDQQEQLKKKNEDLAAMKSRYNNVVFVFVFGCRESVISVTCCMKLCTEHVE